MTRDTDAEQRLGVFVDCFNICYPDWEIKGDATKQLEPKHVDYDETLRKTWGKCGPRSNGRVYYRLNREWWNDNSPEQCLTLVIHELAHIKHCPGHPPAFWDVVVKNYFRLAERPHEVDDIMGESIEWGKVVQAILDDPHNGLVDNRKETVYERRLKLADELGYPPEDLAPFKNTKVRTRHRTGHNYEEITPDQLEFTEIPPKEVAEYFRARPRPRLSKNSHAYILDPPLVQKTNGSYEVIENDSIATLSTLLLDQSSRDTLTVEIQ